jgi:hypothetical protein
MCVKRPSLAAEEAVEAVEGEGSELAGKVLVPHGLEHVVPSLCGDMRRHPVPPRTVFDSGEDKSYNLTR